MLLAQPTHGQRPAVIVVVRFHFRRTTYFAGLPPDLPPLQGVVDRLPGIQLLAMHQLVDALLGDVVFPRQLRNPRSSPEFHQDARAPGYLLLDQRVHHRPMIEY